MEQAGDRAVWFGLLFFLVEFCQAKVVWISQNVLKSKFIYATIFLQLNVFPEDTVDVELLKKGEIYMEVNMKKKDDGFLPFTNDFIFGP